jgi:tetratricopeptide (TPR) repeat protein
MRLTRQLLQRSHTARCIITGPITLFQLVSKPYRPLGYLWTGSRAVSTIGTGGVVINKSGEAGDGMDVERELFILKRNMGKHYSDRDYEEALKCAVELEDEVVRLYGKNNALFASCRSNIALMNKMLGYNDSAIKQYSEALQIYEDVVGKRHAHYASTLANLGLLYKSMGESAKGLLVFLFGCWVGERINMRTCHRYRETNFPRPCGRSSLRCAAYAGRTVRSA